MGKASERTPQTTCLNHIEYVVEKFDVKNIFFEDDNLTLDLARFEAICDGLIAEKNQDWVGNTKRRAGRLPEPEFAPENEEVGLQKRLLRRGIRRPADT